MPGPDPQNPQAKTEKIQNTHWKIDVPVKGPKLSAEPKVEKLEKGPLGGEPGFVPDKIGVWALRIGDTQISFKNPIFINYGAINGIAVDTAKMKTLPDGKISVPFTVFAPQMTKGAPQRPFLTGAVIYDAEGKPEKCVVTHQARRPMGSDVEATLQPLKQPIEHSLRK